MSEILPPETPAPAPAPPPVAALPPPSAPPPLPPPTPAAAKPRRGFWPLLGVLGFLLLAAGEFYLWELRQTVPSDAGEVANLQLQLSALQQQARPAPDSVTAQADLAEKYAALNAQVAAMQSQVAGDHGALTQLAANSADLTRLTTKIGLLNQIATARMALDAGQPLGEIAGAPPALKAFADTAPPTESELLLTYPQAATAANNASVEKASKNSFWRKVTARLENVITISNGDHVLVGAPAAAITARAQTQLNAGDLAGAVATLDNLSDSTQAAMGNWLRQARALLAARTAMINLGEQN